MTQRSPHDSTTRFVLWNRKHAHCASGPASVVVAHADRAIGESIALLLQLRGFAAVTATGLPTVRLMLDYWSPDALFLDSRPCTR